MYQSHYVYLVSITGLLQIKSPYVLHISSQTEWEFCQAKAHVHTPYINPPTNRSGRQYSGTPHEKINQEINHGVFMVLKVCKDVCVCVYACVMCMAES